MHYDCSGVCLCTIWYTLIAIVMACVIHHALWLLWRFPVRLTHYLMHADCSGVGLYNNLCGRIYLVTACAICISCTLTALVLARAILHALRLLLCLPVYYLVHFKCSRTDQCHIECAPIALVFVFVIFHAVDYDCSCLCPCDISCTLTALVCACVLRCALWLFLCVCKCKQYVLHSNCSGVVMSFLCFMVSLVCACSFANVIHMQRTPIALVLACILLCSMIALVHACSLCCTINLLWRWPVHYVVHLDCHCVGLRIRFIHAGCYGVCMCNNSYTLTALV